MDYSKLLEENIATLASELKLTRIQVLCTILRKKSFPQYKSNMTIFELYNVTDKELYVASEKTLKEIKNG